MEIVTYYLDETGRRDTPDETTRRRSDKQDEMTGRRSGKQKKTKAPAQPVNRGTRDGKQISKRM